MFCFTGSKQCTKLILPISTCSQKLDELVLLHAKFHSLWEKCHSPDRGKRRKNPQEPPSLRAHQSTTNFFQRQRFLSQNTYPIPPPHTMEDDREMRDGEAMIPEAADRSGYLIRLVVLAPNILVNEGNG